MVRLNPILNMLVMTKPSVNKFDNALSTSATVASSFVG
jgi:hypothetical protein